MPPWGRLSIALIVFASLLANAVLSQPAIAQDTETSLELPEVSVQAMLFRDDLERGQTTQLYVIVTNKSKTALRDVSFSIVPEGFTVNTMPAPIPDIPPFGSAQTSVDLNPAEEAGFGKHTLIVTVHYSWGDDAEFVSSQSVTVGITVKRKFEDELAGLFGGGAALLYFLLPIYPAIVAYKFIEMLRKGEAIKMPSVNLANVFPGAVASIVANLAIRPFIGTGDILDDLWSFFGVVGGSLVVGAVIPGIRWLWDERQQEIWGYKESDSYVEMLRKTLTRPRLPEPANSWVTVKIGTETWEGFLLEKRKNACVLGAILKATIKASIGNEEAEAIQKQVWDEKGKVRDAKKLIRLVKGGSIEIDKRDKITHKLDTGEEEKIELNAKIIPGICEVVNPKETPYVEYVP